MSVQARPYAASEGILAELGESLKGVAGEVFFDAGTKALYSSDASNYRQVPIAVVVPKNTDDMVATLAACHALGVPVLPRGGGTSQNGQCVNVAVVIDSSRYVNHVLAIDPQEGTALVEPGVICDTLRDAAELHGLTFAPDPATHSRCTLGGMIGNNSCGAHSVMAGKTVENVEMLEVCTYDGERFWVGPTTDEELASIIAAGGRRGQVYADLRALRDRYADAIRTRFPNIKRRVSGFNLDQLLPENGFNVARALVGTEGTCALTLQAKVRLVHSPAERVQLVLGFDDIYVAADAVPEYQALGPIAIEGLDRQIIRGLQARKLSADDIALLPAGDAWVVLEFGGDTLDDAVAQARAAADYFALRPVGPRPSSQIVTDKSLQARVWGIRELGASATALSIEDGVPDPGVGWEDAAVDPARLGDYLRDFQQLVDSFGYRTSLYGHFGDGCVHARITFDLQSAQGILDWRSFLKEAAQLVVDYGGSLSGEHGDGQAKAEFLPIMYGPELMAAMETFKAIWDPTNKMNPGKVVHAYRADENLRVGPTYKKVDVHTRLFFQTEEGDGFGRQMERCIGAGRCRSLKGSTMCPSFQATRDERQSTRGRAHLLWEMLQGDVIKDGWRSDEVKQALDTCLACKGCRSDCPTHTDMASYKAEFLSQYYEHKPRPRQAWFMGRVGQWAPYAARLPRLFNWANRAPVLSGIVKRVAGVAAARRLPTFAKTPFRQLHEGKPAANSEARRVILWVDTFNNHFDPKIAQAAVEVLAAVGYEVVLPEQGLCCGRPLYDFGLLDSARRHLLEIVDSLRTEIELGTPLVGLEPGCLSVFKDELPKQLPGNTTAALLSAQTHLLSDFLAQEDFRWPQLQADVLVHGHCHQKSLFGMKGETALLDKLGVKWKLMDSGCCGMAGSFGFNPDHYDLSQTIGEQTLFPAVRAASADTLVLSNGFSCREQIEQGTGKPVVHVAQLLQMALAAGA